MRAPAAAKASGRRFTLIDATVLIAATATGLAGMRAIATSGLSPHGYENIYYISQVPTDGWTARELLDFLARVVALPWPLLVAWTPTLLALRLRRPRPSLRRLVLQPGAAACIAATLSMAVRVLSDQSCQLLAFILEEWLGFPAANAGPLDFDLGHPFTFYGLTQYIHNSAPAVVCSVLTAWTLLFLSRLGRPEASWIDRAGRTVGAFWIVTSVGRWWLRTSWYFE